MNERRGIAVLGLVAALAACASPQGLAPRSSQMAEPNNLAASLTLAGTAKSASWPANAWWQVYGDAQLDTLVAEALAGNPDLRLAQARLDGATAQAGAVGAVSRPRLAADANASRQRFSEHDLIPPPYAGTQQSTGHYTLDFAWELDFWGKNKAALAAALSRQAAAEVDQAAARLVLATAVCRAYGEFARLADIKENLEASLALRQESERLMKLRVGAGLEQEAEVRQSRASVAVLRAELAGLGMAEAAIRHQLAALAGAGPDRGLALRRPQLLATAALALPSELPAELLGRRPDVVAARLRVEAALGASQSARAAFYPNVNLAAFVGGQSLGLTNLFQAGSRVAGISPALSLPIFDGGTLRAGLAGRLAEFDGAVAEYDARVLAGLQDVSDQVTAWRGLAAQTLAQELALTETHAAWELLRRRESAGLVTHLAVISAESRLLEQRRSLSELSARRLDVSIQINRALGGGFAAPGQEAISRSVP